VSLLSPLCSFGTLRIVKTVSVNICLIIFVSKNVLKQGDTLLPLPFNIALQYDVRKVQENQVGLKLNGSQQFLAWADDVIYWKITRTV
jgi:hypothetical protein